MQEIFVRKLHQYISENNPDLLLQLENEGRVGKYLSDKVNTVSALFKQRDIRKPVYILEDICMYIMTQNLRPSTFNYIINLLQEEFESTYNRLRVS